MKRSLRLAVVVSVLFGLGCGQNSGDDGLVLYSGRSQSLVEPILKRFEDASGIVIQVKYGSSAQLAIALQEEGDKSPADVFWAQDAGALGALSSAQLFSTLPTDAIEKVLDGFRHPDNEWVATSGRARVFAYSSARVAPDEMPNSVFDLYDPHWKGRVGWAPLNASFQSFVTAMRETHGNSLTMRWLTGMINNDVKSYSKNTAIIEAIAAGEIDMGLPNHYYLLRFKSEDADYPVEQSFFEPGDIGNLVNVAGIGILETSSRKEQAEQFVRYLLSAEAQEYFVSEIFEYPVVDVPLENPSLVDIEELRDVAPKVNLEDLRELNETLDMLRRVELL